MAKSIVGKASFAADATADADADDADANAATDADDKGLCRRRHRHRQCGSSAWPSSPTPPSPTPTTTTATPTLPPTPTLTTPSIKDYAGVDIVIGNVDRRHRLRRLFLPLSLDFIFSYLSVYFLVSSSFFFIIRQYLSDTWLIFF